MKNRMCVATVPAILAASCMLSSVEGTVTIYPNKLSLLTAIHADTLNIGGLASPNVTPQPRGVLAYSGNGRNFTIDSDISGPTRLMSWGTGVGAPNPVNKTLIQTGGRSISAFGCFLRVANNINQSVGGTVWVYTAGDVFPVSVPPGGLYLAFTTSAPISVIALDAENGAHVEMIDDVLVGDVAGKPATDQAADAGRALLQPNPFDTTYATDDTFNFLDTSGTSRTTNSHDVWWTYKPIADGILTLDTQASNFDTVLAIYAAPGVGVSNPSIQLPIAMNDDYFGLQSFIQTPVTAGQTYYIRLGGYNGARGGGSLNIAFTADTPCEADFNHDAVIDFFDYLDFVDAFSVGC